MKSGRSDIRPPVSFKLDGPHVPFSFHAAKCFADSPAYCLTDTVSINMAKNQLLALNIQKLSGQCGKLMCCLRFENEEYTRMRKDLPKINSTVTYKDKKYRISSMNVLQKQAKLENKEEVLFVDFKELWPDKDFNND